MRIAAPARAHKRRDEEAFDIWPMANGREERRDPCRLFSSRGNVIEDGAVAIIDLAGGGQAAPGRTRSDA